MFGSDRVTPEVLLGLGNLARGNNWGEQFANAGTGVLAAVNSQKERTAADEVKNKTAEMLQVEAPDLAIAVKNGALTATDAYRQFLDRKAEAEKAKRPDYQMITTPDGRLIRAEKNSGTIQELGNYAKPELPSDYKDYQQMQSDPAYAAWKKQQQAAKDAPSSQDQFKNEVEVMKSYRSEPAVKDFGTIKNSYERMREAARLGSGQGDIAIIYSYMKMLDPTSVVREGEYATAQNTSGVPQGIIAKYNSLLNGEKLTPEQRKQFVAAAETQFNQAASTLGEVNARYEGLANQYGVPTERFIERSKEYPALNLDPGDTFNTTVNGKPVTIQKLSD